MRLLNRKNRISTFVYCTAFAIVNFLFSHISHAESFNVVQSAQDMVAKGHYAMAYELLKEHETELAGNNDFDYIFGVASLESGNLNHAIFALERVIATDPNFGGAHMDLGRAFYLLAEYNRAKSEFETVLALDPPPTLRSTTNEYLEKINNLLQKELIKTNITAEISTGFDSNFNNGSYHESIVTPIATFALSETSRSLKTNTFSEKIGSEVQYVPNKFSTWSVGTNGTFSQYSNYRSYDSLTATAYAQYAFNSVYRRVSLSMLRHQAYLGKQLNNYGIHFNGQYQHNLSTNISVSTIGGVSSIRHPTVLSVRNYNRFMAGSAISALAYILKPMSLSAAVFISRDQPLDSNSVWGNDMVSLQLNSNTIVSRSTSINNMVQLSVADYHRPVLLIDRRDYQANAKITIANKFSKSWSVESVAGLMSNRSRFDLYDFDKFYATLGIKRNLL